MLEKITIWTSLLGFLTILVMTIVNFISHNFFYISYSIVAALAIISILINVICRYKKEKDKSLVKMIVLFSITLVLDLISVFMKIF